MEEEGGDDSEMIDAMEGWDSEDNNDDQTDDKDKKKSSKTKDSLDAAWGFQVLEEFCEVKSLHSYAINYVKAFWCF